MGAVVSYLRAFADPTMLKVALIGLGLLMSLLVFLTPLVRPLLESLGAAPFLVPLLALAASVVLLVLRVGSPWQRDAAKQLGVIAVATYLFLGLYRLVLEYAQTAETRNAVGVLLLSIVGVGILLVLVDRGSLNTLSEQPTSAGNALRGALLSVVQRIEALPKALRVLALGSVALALLLAMSHYVFILGYVLVGASTIALVVQAARRKPSKQEGFACLASIALTLVFGGISHGLYDTGTGLRVSVTPTSGSEEEIVSDASKRQYDCRPMADQYGQELRNAKPRYKVVDSKVSKEPSGVMTRFVTASTSPDEPGYLAIYDEIAMQNRDYDIVVIYLPFPNSTSEDVVTVANTPAGEAQAGLTNRYTGSTGSCKYRIVSR